MFAFAFTQPGHLFGEAAITKRIVGVGQLPFLVSLRPHLSYYFRALLVRQLMFEMME